LHGHLIEEFVKTLGSRDELVSRRRRSGR